MGQLTREINWLQIMRQEYYDTENLRIQEVSVFKQWVSNHPKCIPHIYEYPSSSCFSNDIRKKVWFLNIVLCLIKYVNDR